MGPAFESQSGYNIKLIHMGKSTKGGDGFKKAHHGNLGVKPSKHLNRIEEEDAELNIKYDFEDYCGNCDNFGNPDICPFIHEVNEDSHWKDVGCNYFDD